MTSVLTIRIRIRQRDSVAGELLEGPELIDAVKYRLWPVYQTAAHLLQVTQNGDVTVRLDPRGRNAHYGHLRVRGHDLLSHPQTWEKQKYEYITQLLQD